MTRSSRAPATSISLLLTRLHPGRITLVPFILFTLLAIAAFMRLYKLSEIPPGLYWDEGFNGNAAIEALENRHFQVAYADPYGREAHSRFNSAREGIPINLQALSLAVLGNKAWALRLVSAVIGSATVLGVYLLASELFWTSEARVRLALLSAFFVAASFWHINFSRIAFHGIMVPFCLAFAFYFLLRAFRTPSLPGLLRNAAIGGIIFGLGFYTYPIYRLAPVVYLVACILWWVDADKARRGAIILACFVYLSVALVTAIPIALYFIRHPTEFLGRARELSILGAGKRTVVLNILQSLGMFSFIGDWNWRHNVPGRPLLFWPLGLALIIGAGKAVFEISRAGTRAIPYLLATAWLLVMLVPCFVTKESPHALRALGTLPAVFVITAVGVDLGWGWVKSRAPSRASTCLASLFIAATCVAGPYQYFFQWARQPQVAEAFTAVYVAEADYARKISIHTNVYILADVYEESVTRGLPIQTQTIIFLLGGWNRGRWPSPTIRIVTQDRFEALRIVQPATIILMDPSPYWETRIMRRFPNARRIDDVPFNAYALPTRRTTDVP